MPRSSSVSPNSLTGLADSLRSLPDKEKETYTLKEAVAALADPIHTALERGYSYPDIAVILHDKGIPISPASLKAYLPRKKQTRRSRKTTSPAAVIEANSTPAPAAEEAEAAPKETAPKRRGRQPGKTKTAATADKAAPKTADKASSKAKAAPARTAAGKDRGRKK
ncbi:hypothetical protein [Leptolyngbya ohadii]|uniref:hypothetical protein n=1 Tax=Leptolyngbya ohadii TaxID=1962290 RepID=UPI000B59981B|nr:hypothetical protein [Leptolyngbya ohadii]